MKTVLSSINQHLTAIFVVVILATVGLLAVFASPNEDGTRTFDGTSPTYTDAQKQALCETKNKIDQEVQALSGINVPQDATSGCAPTDLPQMGSLTYYKVGMATPTAFKNSILGKGFNEGYGLQCVAGFKEFMFSLSGKYVAAAGGGAKGYATQQKQIEPLGFKWYAGTAGMQDGDWAIWTNGQYGHVAMKFGNQWLGQNQYAADPNRGNAFNLANISASGIAGYYRPNIYIAPALTPKPSIPTPTLQPPVTLDAYSVRQGDTLGGIAIKQGWYRTGQLYGDDGYAQSLADFNGIEWRGLIFPGQEIRKK